MEGEATAIPVMLEFAAATCSVRYQKEVESRTVNVRIFG